MKKIAWTYILHADMDAFYASVEQLDNPKYRGLPLVVGGSPSERGVVAAASYEARQYGIRSAMPMRTAIQINPSIIRVRPRFERYKQISSDIMDVFRRLTPILEPLSLDEAYLDISKQVPRDMVQDVAEGLKSTIHNLIGLRVTIGGGTSKTVAKIASQIAKPDGMLLIDAGSEQTFLKPLPVNLLWGVGPRTEDLLRKHGIITIGDLADQELKWTQRVLGKRGIDLRMKALGQDNEPVKAHRDAKSISSEPTLMSDTGNIYTLEETLKQLSEQVSQRLQKQNLRCSTITVKFRLTNFATFTRQETFKSSTADAEVIYQAVKNIFHREYNPSMEFRLLGVGASGFQQISQLPLFPVS